MGSNGIKRTRERRVLSYLVFALAACVLAFGALLASAPQQALAATSGTWRGIAYDMDDAGNVMFHAGTMTAKADDTDSEATDGTVASGSLSEDAVLKDAVSVRADGKVVLPEDSSYLFSDCADLTSVDLTNFDTSQVTNLSGLFLGSMSLVSANLVGLDTSRVTDLSGMFYWCESLTSLDLSSFDTSKVKNMSEMFFDCQTLATLDISSFDTSKVTNMGMMFYGCLSLPSLDLSTFDTSKVTKADLMFYWCESLTSLDLSAFDTSKVKSMSEMFYSCNSLQSVKLGKSFSFNGAGSKRLCALPDGTWKSSADGKSYAGDAIPNNVAATYTKTGSAAAKKSISGATVKLSKTSYTYNGSAKKPTVTVTLNGTKLEKGANYTVSYKNNTNAGTATVTVRGAGNYSGSAKATFTIEKAANTLTVKPKTATVKYSKLKYAEQTLSRSKVLIVSKAKGAVTYKLSSVKEGSKSCKSKFTVNAKTGKVTVAKGLAEGIYSVQVKVKAAGTGSYKAKTVTKTCKVKVA